MNKIHKVDSRHQVKSISNGLKILPWMALTLPVAYFGGFSDILLDPDFLSVLIIFSLTFFLPAFILHFTYYLANRDTTLEIDSRDCSITIINRTGEFYFKTDEIKRVERIIYSDYRHSERHQNWFLMPWRNYGYLKLITKDNQVFLFTSLLIDPLNPPIRPTVTKYSFFQFLDDDVEEEPSREEMEGDFRAEVEAYKVKFQNQVQEDLIKKTVLNGYRTEAAIAANELIEERKTIANKTYTA